jgi:hypothetical protein
MLGLLTLKRVRNWGYQELEREVRANLVCRDFNQGGDGREHGCLTRFRARR